MERSDVGQLLLVGVPGTHLDSETARIFRKVQPGGYILFGRNVNYPRQLRKLVDDLRDLSRTEPIISVDQEGGRVSRLKLMGNEPPNAQQLREKGEESLIRLHGELTGQLLRLFGFNLDLCPVLDISFGDEADNSLRGRCYGKTVGQVIRFASAFNEALLESGVLTCGKHFPGYAAASLDPHHDLPRIDRTRAELLGTELAIFRHFAGKVPSIMVGHAWYPAFDHERVPASLSRRVVTDLLKTELGFSGLAVTDDLDMGAIVNEYALRETISRAIQAGNDLAVICHRIPMVEEAQGVLAAMEAKDLDRALEAVAVFKRKLPPPDVFSEDRFQELDAKVGELRVRVLGAERAAQRSPEDGKRSPVEMY
jgi:beta-N-acetylhexosaminidase